jgi:hypothetical protein
MSLRKVQFEPGLLVNWELAGKPRRPGDYNNRGVEISVSAEQLQVWKANPLAEFELVRVGKAHT